MALKECGGNHSQSVAGILNHANSGRERARETGQQARGQVRAASAGAPVRHPDRRVTNLPGHLSAPSRPVPTQSPPSARKKEKENTCSSDKIRAIRPPTDQLYIHHQPRPQEALRQGLSGAPRPALPPHPATCPQLPAPTGPYRPPATGWPIRDGPGPDTSEN